MTTAGMQPAQAVAYRALCLGGILKRGELEIGLREMNHQNATTDEHQAVLETSQHVDAQLRHWLDQEQLTPHLTHSEERLLALHLGEWSERDIIETSWRIESLGILLWALQVVHEIPAYDAQFDPRQVLEPLDVLTPTIDFVWRAELRDERLLRRLRDQAELWNWRSRLRELQRLGIRPTNGVSFEEIIRAAARQGCEAGILPPPIDDDFPLFGTCYARLTPQQNDIATSIAYERALAFNWVCEWESTWETIRIDS